jgi:hypothetical protein
MTPKQILDSFSETLMRDDRILSSQERTLLSTLLHQARIAAITNEETRDAVRGVIASAVGETVAQRAFAVLGASIVERILESSSVLSGSTTRSSEFLGNPTPAPQPQGPGVKAPRKEPHVPLTTPDVPTPPAPVEPQGPKVKEPREEPNGPMTTPMPPAPQPQGPGMSDPRRESPVRGIEHVEVLPSSVAVMERPEVLPARCVVLDEFLAPPELDALTRFALEREPDFQVSEVVSPASDHGMVNYEHRRSRVLMELQEHEQIVLKRIKAALPQVLETLGIEEFSISGVEAQITASNDGDFFRFHSDNGSDRVASRHLTFVYFFHREPRAFEGGELRIHDARLEDGMYESQGTYQAIVPQQNQIVFFPCELLHEITPVKCASQRFADSRFTLNGWLRR